MSGISEKIKNANKGGKGRTKGQGAKHVKVLVFLVVLGLSGVNNALISLFLSFKAKKAKKAKKAAIEAGKAKLQMQKFVEPKILLQHPKELFKLPLTQNRAGP